MQHTIHSPSGSATFDAHGQVMFTYEGRPVLICRGGGCPSLWRRYSGYWGDKR
jgi:hypothetical protein